MSTALESTDRPAPAWTTLADEQAAAFDRDGYLVVRQAIPYDMIDQLVTAGDQLIASDRRRDRQTGNGGRSDGFRNLLAVEPAFLPLLTWPATFPLVVQLMGPNLQLHTSHQIWRQPDPPGSPEAIRSPDWHRDIANVTRDLDHDRMPRVEIKVAFFLSDCSQSGCGQTLVAAGSHRWREPWRREPGVVDPPGAVEPLLRAGDALLFENRTWHAGGSHRVARTRKTVMLGYSHRWMRADDYQEPAPELLARCQPVAACLLDARESNRGVDGRFQPGGGETPLQAWAAAHGYEQPACH